MIKNVIQKNPYSNDNDEPAVRDPGLVDGQC